MAVDYLLFESSVGYAIFKVTKQADTIGSKTKEVLDKIQDLSTFGKMVQLVSFAPFQGASQALQEANDLSEGVLSNYLAAIIETNILPTDSKKSYTLAIFDPALAAPIRDTFKHIKCETPATSTAAAELLRGLRQHATKLLGSLQPGDIERAQLGLGHAYSRAKVKFNVQRNDNHIIQAIAILDHLDKAVNTVAMRTREWYSWHFPELIKIVSDNLTYAKLIKVIGDKSTVTDDKLHDIAALVEDDETISKSIIDAARVSMGRDISETDLEHVITLAQKTIKLSECRKLIQRYLSDKMGVVAPNLSTLIGDAVGARLISKAGSLTNLAKCPASTVQILGAEKALFRALKTKGKTPKYGLIYNSSFIGRAGVKNKGRISRFLANKCAIASRLDSFQTHPTNKFGEALKAQVEERLEFYSSGKAPMKNSDAMTNAMNNVLGDLKLEGTEAVIKEERKIKKDKKDKEDKKRKNTGDEIEPSKEERKKLKKEKKEKKEKKRLSA